MNNNMKNSNKTANIDNDSDEFKTFLKGYTTMIRPLFKMIQKELDQYELSITEDTPNAVPTSAEPVKKMVTNKTKFFYVRSKVPNDVLTIATRVQDNQKEVKIAFAFCSKKDRFTKKSGRGLVFKRLIKGHDNTFMTEFTGHSVDAIIKVWGHVKKPKAWLNRQLVMTNKFQLDFMTKV